MPSDDKNTIEFPSKDKGNVAQDNAKKTKTAVKVKKPRKSIGWVIGVIILILISVTFILPTTIFTPTSQYEVVFGKYNGKKISLEMDNFFYYQLQTIANYYSQQYGGSLPQEAWFQVYYQAFQNSIIYEAVSEMANKAKIAPSSEAITKAVIDSGYWNDENGVFDKTRYQSATSSEKSSAQKMAELSLPYTMVMSDIQSVKIPQAEVDFISSLSDTNTRSFDYLVIDSDSYGDDEARTYANNNPEPFVQLALSALSYSTETEAKDMLEKLNAGSATFEEALETSVNGYKENGGSMGNVLKNTLDTMLMYSGVEDASDLVFSATESSYVGPYYTSSGYTIFRVDSKPEMANLYDEDVLSSIKSYISSHDNAIITTYLGGVANDAYAVAQEDVDKAISQFNLDYYTVDNVAMNAGSSNLVYSIQSADTAGFMSTAITSDPEYLKTLYSVDYDTVLAPQVSGSSYIIAIPVEANQETDENSYTGYMRQMIPTLYKVYAGQFGLQDLQSSIISSDKVQNNFFETYYNKIMGGSF